jgi:hypothetical protein
VLTWSRVTHIAQKPVNPDLILPPSPPETIASATRADKIPSGIRRAHTSSIPCAMIRGGHPDKHHFAHDGDPVPSGAAPRRRQFIKHRNQPLGHDLTDSITF